MAENNENNIVNSTADDQEKNKQKGNKINPNKVQNIIKFISTHIVPISYVAVALLIIIFIIGILQILITMPGLILGKLKEAATNLWAEFTGSFTADNISPKIGDDEINELAKYVQDMGYDIIGFGFGDVKQEDNDDEKSDDDSIELQAIDRNYLKAYLVQNVATYSRTKWNFGGFFGGDAYSNSIGMINITKDGNDLNNEENPLIEIAKIPSLLTFGLIPSIIEKFDDWNIEINAESKYMMISQNFGETFYIDMSDWSSKYGKPMELFLALHLSTMMPDLAYDMATSDAFNTKVNIDLQRAKYTKNVTYNKDNHTYNEEELLQDYIKLVTGKETEKTGDELIEEAENIEEIDLMSWDFSSTVYKNFYNNIDKDNEEEKRKIAKSKVEALIKLVLNKEEKDIYWPRITTVENHWYYNKITFDYETADSVSKKMLYQTEDNTDPLYQESGIVFEATIKNENGVYYQKGEPILEGPNDAIIALFKGGNENYPDFTGEYYRYDGTRLRAKSINRSRALDNDEDEYLFEGKYFSTKDSSVPKVKKEPVVFYKDGKNTNKNAFTAFAILEKTHTEEAEVSYRCLKELLVELDYFTEDELKEPVTQVLKWILPGNTDKINIRKNANSYGMIIQNNNNEDEIIAPGDGKIIDIEDNTITMEFTKLNQDVLTSLQEKYKDDGLYYIDENSIVGLQMVIVGITPSVNKGQTVTVGDIIGNPLGNVQVYFKREDGSIVDDVEKYMDVYNKNFENNN